MKSPQAYTWTFGMADSFSLNGNVLHMCCQFALVFLANPEGSTTCMIWFGC